jgi:hypothetical protein
MLVPLTLPGDRLSGIRVDPASSWHVSALLEVGLESAALPSRLRKASQQPTDLLGGLADMLNSAGNQTISKLHVAVTKGRDNSRRSAKTPQSTTQTDDAVSVGSSSSHGFSLSSFPELLGGVRKTATAGDSERLPASVFGQILVQRNTDTEQDMATDPLAANRNGARPVSKRCACLYLDRAHLWSDYLILRQLRRRPRIPHAGQLSGYIFGRDKRSNLGRRWSQRHFVNRHFTLR